VTTEIGDYGFAITIHLEILLEKLLIEQNKKK
jgi:hypothetical protein